MLILVGQLYLIDLNLNLYCYCKCIDFHFREFFKSWFNRPCHMVFDTYTNQITATQKKRSRTFSETILFLCILRRSIRILSRNWDLIWGRGLKKNGGSKPLLPYSDRIRKKKGRVGWSRNPLTRNFIFPKNICTKVHIHEIWFARKYIATKIVCTKVHSQHEILPSPVACG